PGSPSELPLHHIVAGRGAAHGGDGGRVLAGHVPGSALVAGPRGDRLLVDAGAVDVPGRAERAGAPERRIVDVRPSRGEGHDHRVVRVGSLGPALGHDPGVGTTVRGCLGRRPGAGRLRGDGATGLLGARLPRRRRGHLFRLRRPGRRVRRLSPCPVRGGRGGLYGRGGLGGFGGIVVTTEGGDTS